MNAKAIKMKDETYGVNVFDPEKFARLLAVREISATEMARLINALEMRDDGGKLVRVSKQVVGLWLTGGIRPTPYRLWAICRVLDVHAAELMSAIGGNNGKSA